MKYMISTTINYADDSKEQDPQGPVTLDNAQAYIGIIAQAETEATSLTFILIPQPE